MRASSTAAVDSNAAGGPYRPRVRFATDAPYLRTPALLLPLLLPLLLLPGRSLMARAGGECVPPAFNPEAAAPGSCHLLQRVCVDEGTILSFDTQFRGLEKPPFPRIEQVPWNFPARGAANSDALLGHMPEWGPTIRAATPLEAQPYLLHPAFSRCTLPVAIWTAWPYNYFESFAQMAAIAHRYISRKGMTDGNATLVLATPMGMSLLPYHRVLMAPYSVRQLVTLDEVGQRGGEGQRAVGWSAEGYHVHCFERMVVCSFVGYPQTTFAPAHAVMAHPWWAAHAPPDPLGFAATSVAGAGVGAGAGAMEPGTPAPGLRVADSAVLGVRHDTTLRVVVEARTGGARSLLNLHELIEACHTAHRQGFMVGHFVGVSCRVLGAVGSSSSHKAGSGAPRPRGTHRVLAAAAAVRSAHVFVAVHGAGTANAAFMQQGPCARLGVADPAGGGATGGVVTPAEGGYAEAGQQPAAPGNSSCTALLEIRPCRFGTRYYEWPNGFAAWEHNWEERINPAAPKFFALNVEDPSLCRPPDYEAAYTTAMANGSRVTNTRLGRYSSESFRSRDQHVSIRPAMFMELLRRVAAMLSDPGLYQAAKLRDELHAYAVPGGLFYGPLQERNVESLLQKGPKLVRV